MKDRHPIESKVWRWLTNVWTVILFILILEDYKSGGTLEYLIEPASAIYIGLLAIYSTEKEFERWRFYYTGKHPGEVYVVAWTILVIGILLVALITGSHYQMSPVIFSTYIVVLGLLAVTRKSRSVFIEYHKSRRN